MPPPGILVLMVFAASALYVHLRGRVRYGWLRALTGYTVILAPYNALMYLFSRVRARPYGDVAQFPELAVLQAHWQEIREEALRLDDAHRIREATGFNDIGFNSFYRTGWKRFYLKWYGVDLPSAQALCPRTMELLNGIPSIRGAMFASLPPGARLVRHRDPFAGSLRYHLGLVTPNSPACYIEVDGERYFWRDGEAMMFDETFIHYAENTTDHRRVILFADVERPLYGWIFTALNRSIGGAMMRAASSQNEVGEPIGPLNKVFAYAYLARRQAKKFKERNRRLYYVLKWALIAGIIYLVFF